MTFTDPVTISPGMPTPGAKITSAQADVIIANQEYFNAQLGNQAATLNLINAERFDVMNYGADNTGATDCTTAIGLAITALINKGSGILYFPPGIYTVSSISITGVSGITIAGFGATIIGNTANDPPIALHNCSQFSVSGLDIQQTAAQGWVNPNTGADPAGLTQNGHGIALYACTDGVVFGNTVKYVTMCGVYVSGCNRVSIDDNRVESVYGSGIFVGYSSIDISVTNNKVNGTGDDSIALVDNPPSNPQSQRIVVIGNEILNGGSRGIVCCGPIYVVISDNTINYTSASGILFGTDSTYGTFTSSHVIITGNNIQNTAMLGTLRGNGFGIEFTATTPPTNCTVSQNIVDTTHNSGISVYGSGHSVEGNHVLNAGAAGFSMGASDTNYINNTAESSYQQGFTSNNLTRIVFVGNTARNNNTSNAASINNFHLPNLSVSVVANNMSYDVNGYTTNAFDLAGTSTNVVWQNNIVTGTYKGTLFNIPNTLGQTLNVKDWGAIGNGTANDSTGIQAAINAANAFGGTVYFPPGTYMIGTVLSLGSTSNGVTLQGSGKYTTILRAMSTNTGNVLDIFNCTYVKLEGFTVDMNYSATTKNATVANQVGILIENNNTTNTVSYISLDHLRIINSWHYGLYVVKAAGDNGVNNITLGPGVIVTACSQAATNADAAVYFASTNNVLINGSKIISNVGLAYALAFSGCTNVIIENANISNNAAGGISFVSSTNVSVSDTEASSNGAGYGVAFSTGTSDFTCINVHADSNGTGGISSDLTQSGSPTTLYDAQGIISGCRTNNNTGHGIWFNHCTGLHITDGISSGNTGASSCGIAGSGANCQIGPYVLENNGNYGLSIQAGSGYSTGGHYVKSIMGTGNTTALINDLGNIASNYSLVPGTPVTYPLASVTAATTVKSAITLANATAAAFALTLPAVAAGLTFWIKKTDSSANTVTITPASGTIDGATNYVLSTQYQFVHLTSDGTNWYIIGSGTV